MRKSSVLFFVVVVTLTAGLAAPSFAFGRPRHMRKYKPPPPMASVTVTVVRKEDGKPLRNAAVVFHPQTRDGGNEGNMELKTNDEGKATLTIVPIGSKVLVQVIARGYRTFGQEYTVPEAKKAITVQLRRPEEQYSAYVKGPQNANAQTNAPKTQMGQAAPTDSPLLTPPPKKGWHPYGW